MSRKSFSCVEMKRRGSAVVQRAIEGLTPAQEAKYWKKRTNEMRKSSRRRPQPSRQS